MKNIIATGNSYCIWTRGVASSVEVGIRYTGTGGINTMAVLMSKDMAERLIENLRFSLREVKDATAEAYPQTEKTQV